MGQDGARRKVEALEKRLGAMVAEGRCSLCETRTGSCPECHRPLGPHENQVATLLADLDARLVGLAERTPPSD